MIKVFAILLMIVYVIFSIYFLYVFSKNEYNLRKTFNFFKKRCKFCSMLKNIKKETDVIEINTEEGVKKIEVVKGDMEDCEAPLGFPFDICFNPNNMREEDKELREKLIQILAQRKQYIIDGGKKKLIIPLEATQFLTKNLNPLVNEYGEIIIVPKEKTVLEQLKHAIFTIKNIDVDLEDKTETELVKNLELLKKLERVHNEKLEKIQEKKRKSRKDRKKEKIAKEQKEIQRDKNNETGNQESKLNVSIEKKTNNQDENVQDKKIDVNSKTEESVNENIGVHAHQSDILNPNSKTNTKEDNEIAKDKKNTSEKLSFDIKHNSNKDLYKENKNIENENQTKEKGNVSKKAIDATIQNSEISVVHAHQENETPNINQQNYKSDTKVNIKNIENEKKENLNNAKKTNDEEQESLLSFNPIEKNNNKNEPLKKERNKEGSANKTKIDLNNVKPNNPTSDIIEDAMDQKEEIVISENKDDKAKEMLNQKKIDIQTIKEFYTNVLQYKHLYEPPVFNKENLIKNLNVLNDRTGIGLFFNNLAKTTPLIYTDNKESVFADWKNIYIAFAMLYGAEFKNVITALLTPKMEEKIQFNKAFAHVLSDYIDEHFTGGSEFCSMVLINKKTNQKFRAYGAFFLMNDFKLGLKENQIDFFRSFPYNSLHKIETIAKGLNLFEKKYPVLIGKPNEVLIK